MEILIGLLLLFVFVIGIISLIKIFISFLTDSELVSNWFDESEIPIKDRPMVKNIFIYTIIFLVICLIAQLFI
ncbi:hypothetical protein, partial [Tenacibaculum sp. 190524A02b]|uniref:hypothetical protein n=1 Tax=Tenacibaculum vairaonense TaxID=3137860 RepID=UPI0032B12060